MYKRCINSGDVLAFNRLIIHTCVGKNKKIFKLAYAAGVLDKAAFSD